ncbi:response regulator [Novosphingobium sp. B 225]|uniref:response regulator n=1 Tax=Novosphingobium sp. B 225 TaxID=1961849 RepID=UPI000B4AD0E2|nr:response regulator transcription factor [Novosphingobium sp. B 225]
MARILIVDDHAFFRRGLEAALVSRGHQIVGSIAAGEDALEALSTVETDMILLDLKMRSLDGVAVLQAMRARQDTRPVIVLTAQLTDEALVGLMRSSVNGIVFKHCSEERLFEAIEAVSKGLRFVDGSLVDKAFALNAKGSSLRAGAALSQREQQVADLAVLGLRNKEIADRLKMSEAMVKLYLHKVFQKLGASNRTELAALRNNTLS